MTLDKTSYIKIPTWILTIGLPLVISGLGAYITVRIVLANQGQEIQNMKSTQIEFKETLKTKANVETVTSLKESVDDVKDQMTNLNNKLDRYIFRTTGITVSQANGTSTSTN